MVRRWRQLPQWRRDAALAVAVALVALAGGVAAPPARLPFDAGAALLLLGGALPLTLRARFPRPVLVVAAACLVGYLVAGYPGVAPAVPAMVALYTVVRAGHRVTAGATIAAILVLGFAGELLRSAGDPPPDLFQRWFLLIGWMVAASVLGEVFRQHRAYLDEVEQRAADAERTREETARRRADEERIRIARELHDSLTHSISIIKVQAGVAVHLARRRDEPVPAALVAIQQASGDAMRELRDTLEVLRGDAPESGLARLDALVDGARRAGLPVTVHVDGEPRALPGPVDGAAYRIVQEALTNVSRHAGAATAAVHLGYGEETLTVRVDDTGHGTAARGVAGSGVPGGGVAGSVVLGDGVVGRGTAGSGGAGSGGAGSGDAGRGDAASPRRGLGLTGMHERVAALGGSLHAGPRPEGGFTVSATLPLVAA
ncbi:histidine kinase [Dactylosporangium sp. AC04546]|uniref:sensor histidine kinase n=1 Tax=Dactylosporangium sp. AC04546 TaxID=2862460 RepID=UPI001EE03D35|nr:histidine kinase [Dactylosporangium sp. AC04546]WVK87463.1 histidine kinase [Dactylosporangium sp. AC04546]